MSAFSKLVVATTHSGPVEKLITGTRPGKALARRFVAGDTLDDAVVAARRLNSSGMVVSLDLLGEEVHDVESALAARDEYLGCMERVETESLNANISVKLTQLGLSIDEDLALSSISHLADVAASHGSTVTIDMEDSRYTDATVRVYEEAQADKGNLGIAIQAYMRRTPDDLRRLVGLGGHIRLCKGAYVESEGVALTSKEEVDAAYADQLRDLMANPHIKPAVATHDRGLINLALKLAEARAEYFEFQMLYGVRTAVQEELVAAGYPVRVYLPFGSQWYPYLTRRLAERPANAWFFAKAAFGR